MKRRVNIVNSLEHICLMLHISQCLYLAYGFLVSWALEKRLASLGAFVSFLIDVCSYVLIYNFILQGIFVL